MIFIFRNIANITNNILTDSGVATSALQIALNGTGFVKISGTTISYDNSTYALDSAVVHNTGNETIGDRVYFGTRSCVKQKITICDDVVIGMNAGVVKNITESGTYVGCPAIKIK